MNQVHYFMDNPHEVQAKVLKELMTKGQNTVYGKLHGMSASHSYHQFSQSLPVVNYDRLKPFIERVMRGEQNVLWSSKISWFAKSSGTASGKSKFIPVSMETLDECHYKAGKDLVGIYCHNHPDTGFFTGKGLVLGGSHEPVPNNNDAKLGDVSAVMLENLPLIARIFRAPNNNIAVMGEWEKKLDIMAETTTAQNMTNMAGVPSWTMVLLKKILERTGKNKICDVWPNLELYIHGGVNFEPYRSEFENIIGKDINFLQAYNASEGHFGIQYERNSDDMLLMMDYGIFFEFIPWGEINKEDPKVIPLSDVEVGKHYAILITTNSGLWRYKIGDTVEFTSVHPYKIKVSGRTKSFINAFGEELIVDNAEKAISAACRETGARIKDYTAGPVYQSVEDKGSHEWAIEFEREPQCLQTFTELLDKNLQMVNSDYEAKRYKSLALELPKVHSVPRDTFHNWMRNKRKLSAQIKVPRLSNDRRILNEILQ